MAKRRRAGRGESLFSQQAHVVSRLASKSTEVNNMKIIANRETALQLEISDISKGIQGLGEEEVVFILSCKLFEIPFLTVYQFRTFRGGGMAACPP